MFSRCVFSCGGCSLLNQETTERIEAVGTCVHLGLCVSHVYLAVRVCVCVCLIATGTRRSAGEAQKEEVETHVWCARTEEVPLLPRGIVEKLLDCAFTTPSSLFSLFCHSFLFYLPLSVLLSSPFFLSASPSSHLLAWCLKGGSAVLSVNDLLPHSLLPLSAGQRPRVCLHRLPLLLQQVLLHPLWAERFLFKTFFWSFS